LGVVAAGFAIFLTDLYIIDPVLTFIIIIVIIIGTWDLFSKSFKMAIDAVPHNIDLEKVKEYFNNVPGISSYHDLHIWALSTTESSLTVHIVTDKSMTNDLLLKKLSEDLRNLFNIHHTTIQIEQSSYNNIDCSQCC